MAVQVRGEVRRPPKTSPANRRRRPASRVMRQASTLAQKPFKKSEARIVTFIARQRRETLAQRAPTKA